MKKDKLKVSDKKAPLKSLKEKRRDKKEKRSKVGISIS
ncbi:MAG: hypothetical protein ACI8RU_002605 [Zhongshania aliphaticivorans]|jgi:hypothetical protein|tara:strand:- start:486 stop:599 length:114 start_codon:yes stop_codon:yes gene_type:complete